MKLTKALAAYLVDNRENKKISIAKSGNPYSRGSLSTVDLLAVTSLNQLLWILKTSFTFLQNKLPYRGGKPY